jgi:carbonic anhydrase
MKYIDITYRYDADDATPRERPVNAAAAKRRMDSGNQSFAALLSGLDGRSGTARRVIRIDPSELGILPSGITVLPVQRPYAAILGCSDARVPIELVFNEGPNDLFVVRVAGNTLGEDVRGSLNYALEHLGASLRLIVVLGHSACGAVTAAVDVFLDPAGYLSLAPKHAVRALVDRLLIVVHACARWIEQAFGPDIVRRSGYREALIETSAVANAALAAQTLQREIGGGVADGVRATYGVYVLSDRTIWAPRCGGDEVIGLAAPPVNEQEFVDFSAAVIRSQRITALLAS